MARTPCRSDESKNAGGRMSAGYVHPEAPRGQGFVGRAGRWVRQAACLVVMASGRAFRRNESAQSAARACDHLLAETILLGLNTNPFSLI
ncbi:MAG: hypothetical protein RLZZ188_1030 [Verrucomicrobiota bacterium]|jgi:hypothetical protein